MSTNSQATKKKILMIGSEHWDIETAQAQLRDDTQFEIIGNTPIGVEGIDQIDKLKPDIVIIDIEVRDIESTELAGLIKRRFPGIYIIMFSFANDPTWMRKAIEAGASLFLLKPFYHAEFHLIMNRILSQFSRIEEVLTMPSYICVTCGTQYPESDQPPAHCPICEDERQYVSPDGQQWTTLDALRRDRRNVIEPVEPKLYRLKPEPKIGIGQYAHLVQTPGGNILWDCVPYIDDDTVSAINALGGIRAIAISHPHFHTVMVEWSRVFNDAPIYIHAGNRADVVRPDAAIRYWEGETQLLVDGVTLIHCGGHFAGSAVLHWREGAAGRGVLLTADTIHIVQDTRWATFMRSYPNLIPLPASKVRRIVEAVEPFNYDRIYGSFGNMMDGSAKAKVHASAERYIRAIGE